MGTPMEEVLTVLSKKELADACGVDLTTIYYWETGNNRGKGNGFIPSHYLPRLYDYLQNRKIRFAVERLIGIPVRKHGAYKPKKPEVYPQVLDS